MSQLEQANANRALSWALAAGVAVIAAVKIFLATRLELYSDEIFYWQASTQPAIAYSDLPFMTALMAGLGTWVGGEHPLAVRLVFLGMGTAIPFLIYWLARPLTDRRQALEAAVLSLCLPPAAVMGLLAVPDVLLVFFGLVLIGVFERATRRDTLGLWVGVGLVTALGFCTHYRFVFYPLAIVAFLLVSRQHHYLWATGRLWLAGLIGAVGLYPVLAFNLQHQLSGVEYHFMERHPWTFQVEGLLHPLRQAVVVTPLLYLVLITSLCLMLSQWRRGDDRKGLFAVFALAHIGVFLVLAPWADQERTTIHWPFSGYLAVLVYTPWALRRMAHWLGTATRLRRVRALLMTAPILGFMGSALALAGLGSQGFNRQLQHWIDPEVLSQKMAGWQAMNERLQQLLKTHGMSPETRIVTSNYQSGAQVAFYTEPPGGTFNIDRHKALSNGRRAQYKLWGMTAETLSHHPGAPILFIAHDDFLGTNRKLEVMQRACALFDELTLIHEMSLYDGVKRFSFYKGRVSASPERRSPEAGCDLPSDANLDAPDDGATVSGKITVKGWAYNPGPGLKRLALLVNGERLAVVERSVPRRKMRERLAGQHELPKGQPIGFEYELNTSAFGEGQHTLALEVVSGAGERQVFDERLINVHH